MTPGNYACDRKNHALLIEACQHTINQSFMLDSNTDPMILQRSALFLANLTHSLDLHTKLTARADIAGLVPLLGADDKWTQLYAVRALRQMVCTPKFAKAAILSGRILPVCSLVALMCPVEIVREVMALFR